MLWLGAIYLILMAVAGFIDGLLGVPSPRDQRRREQVISMLHDAQRHAGSQKLLEYRPLANSLEKRRLRGKL